MPFLLIWKFSTRNKIVVDTRTRHVSIDGGTCFDVSKHICSEEISPQYDIVIEMCLFLFYTFIMYRFGESKL